MRRISATVPCTAPPAWAVLERRLFALMSESVHPFLEKYTREDGEYVWEDEWGGGSPDDFYEGTYNWPLLYLLGGGDHLLGLAQRQWEAVTRQLTRLGTVHKEYARREDQFHQAESDIFFYLLCLAGPGVTANQHRARRFAGLYLNEDPEALNYDPERKLILGPLNGSGGPAEAYGGAEPSYGWSPSMSRYGLPHYDVPGIEGVEDLKDPALARRMGQVMAQRMRRGDVVSNLAVTSLVTNAFLLTGEEKYRDWVLEYTDAWFERAADNQGLVPDNVGLDASTPVDLAVSPEGALLSVHFAEPSAAPGDPKDASAYLVGEVALYYCRLAETVCRIYLAVVEIPVLVTREASSSHLDVRVDVPEGQV